MPAKYAKLLMADRETKNAVAGMAFLFVTILLIAHSARPEPTPEEAHLSFPPPRPSAAPPAPSVSPASWSATAHPASASAVYVLAPGRASPFFYKGSGSGSDRERALDCLAAASWYEAGNDVEGQRSVIQVVLNRVRHPSFPNSVCGVVFQGSERATGCQFTFTCDGSMQRRFPSAREWKLARKLAQEALDGAVDVAVGQATHYHADYVAPWWSSALQQVSRIGVHIFYRWPGGRGQLMGKRSWGKEPDALASAGTEEARRPRGAAEPAAFAAAVGKTALASGNQAATGRAHLIAVDPSSASGRWAVEALDACAGRASCAVVAYGNAAERDRNTNLAPGRMDRPLFLFVRDSASGMDVALWDCDRVVRSQASQCLPGDRQALSRLMRDR
ncbi:MAG TPA: cell wall hydrolase [Novosphingobium sp.]|nr:cell wall hydrolase [Novosphingobium sp.]